MKAKWLAFINGKGGCAKTTSLFNVAGVLAKAGERVLVLDLDKQRNITYTLMKNSETPNKSVVDVMLGDATPEEATGKALWAGIGGRKPRYWGVDVLNGDVRLKDEKLLSGIDAERFGAVMEAFVAEGGYDWVLLDMPPSNAVLNKICFSRLVDFTIVPFSTDEYSVMGYGDILEEINAARELNPELNSLGVFMARHNCHRAGADYIRQMAKKYLTSEFIDVQIPDAAEIPDASFEGRPIVYCRPLSKASRAYEALVNEMVKRINAGQ